jgi:acetyltransferase
MRLVGPNCLGVLAPPIRLNASFAASTPQLGDLALVSQSGAIATGLVEWAALHGIGFSGIVSIGDSIDVDFADLLDHFAVDRNTRAILLYVESVRDARKFMSAARAAARAKPVLVLKSGRHAAGANAAMTHTGARQPSCNFDQWRRYRGARGRSSRRSRRYARRHLTGNDGET